MIRYATIGTNFITEWFLEAAAQIPSLAYAAAYSRKEETAAAFAKKHGAERIYTDLEELAAAPDIDAVYIASPNSLHCEQATLMLSHGKHVLCEKTITSNERELKGLIELAESRGLVLMEAMRSVYEPGFAAIRENLPRLGKIRRVSFQFGKYSSRYDKFKQGIVENAFDPSFSNGALMDIGVYCVHPLVRLFGMPEKILADAVLLPGGVDGAGTILAHYDGMQAELLYSKITDNRLPSQIQGEEGTMVIRDINHLWDVVFYDRKGACETLISLPQQGSLLDETLEWVRLMEGGKTGEEHYAYSLMELRVMDEARRQCGIRFPADGK